MGYPCRAHEDENPLTSFLCRAKLSRCLFRLAELENPVRQHGIRLGDVADRKASVDELKRASLVMRAQSYRRRLFSEFDRTKEVFLP